MTGRSLLPLFLFLATAAHAQYTIPDPELATALQGIVPQAMSGNVLDTTHASVLELTYLNLWNTDISDLNGIRYFTALDSLNVSATLITTLDDLPPSLNWLHCIGAELSALPSDLPNGLAYLNCSYNPLHALPETWPSTLAHLGACSNGLTSIPQLPPALRYLDISINNLSFLPQLPDNITYLDCSLNELTTLTDLPASLEFLDAHANELTSIQNLPDNLTTINCDDNQLATLPALPSGLVTLIANNTGLTNLPALPGTLEFLGVIMNHLLSLPELPASLIDLYVVDNPLTSLPELPNGLRKLSAVSTQLTSLPTLPDSMRVLLVDGNQLTALPELPPFLQEVWCGGNQITTLPELPDGLLEVRCGNNPLQCLPALPSSLVDLRCTSTGITCLPNLPPGLVATEANLGFAPMVCEPGAGCSIPEAITGILFFDEDGDGSKSPAEPALPHGTVEAQPISIQAGADANGRFALPVPPGTYSVQGIPRLYHTITTPAHEVTIAAGTPDTDAYIGYRPMPGIHDLVADVQAGVARPGFENLAYLTVTNNGTETSEAAISFYIDADQSYASSTVAPAFQSGTFVTWNTTLAPGDTWTTNVTLYTAADVVLGTGLMHMITAEPLDIDTVPEDNTAKWQDHVVGSYDPNDKRPSTHSLTPDSVQEGAWIGYTIRFQNTGTFAAENVVIIDTLGSLLQWHSMQYVSASHNTNWVLRDDVLTFSFNNIQLPDSASDPEGSQGYVHFRMKVDQGTALGDSIVNVANIYFDFNEPIITAPVVTHVMITTGIADHTTTGTPHVYPNPCNGEFSIAHSGSTGMVRTELRDLSGRLVHSEQRWMSAGTTVRMPLADDLSPGQYLLHMSSADGHRTHLLMIE